MAEAAKNSEIAKKNSPSTMIQHKKSRKAQEAARARDRQEAAAPQNEAEESDATVEEETRERTTRRGRPRGGMKVAERESARDCEER